MSQSYATGAVIGLANVGGLTGVSGWSGGSISNCFATGSVLGVSEVGGLVGQFVAAGAVISNSYSIGTVAYANSDEGPSNIGGLIGSDTGNSVTSSYWNTVTSGQPASAEGTGLTTSELQVAAPGVDGAYTGWSTAIWSFASGRYPNLVGVGGPN